MFPVKDKKQKVPHPIGGGLKLVKGSAEAKAWGERMRALRNK